MPFLDTNSHLTTKPYNFDIKCHSNSESCDRHSFLGPSLGVGQKFLITVGGFYNKREYSGADWLVLLIVYSKPTFQQNSAQQYDQTFIIQFKTIGPRIRLKRMATCISLFQNILQAWEESFKYRSTFFIPWFNIRPFKKYAFKLVFFYLTGVLLLLSTTIQELEFVGITKKDYGRAAQDCEIRSNDKFKSIKHPQQ